MSAELLVVLGIPLVIVLTLVALVTGAIEDGFMRIRNAIARLWGGEQR